MSKSKTRWERFKSEALALAGIVGMACLFVGVLVLSFILNKWRWSCGG